MQGRFAASMSALAVGGMVIAPSTIHAEAPESYKKKSIYDDVDIASPNPAPTSAPKTILPVETPISSQPAEDSQSRGPTPTDRLAVQIGNARLALYKGAVAAEDAVNSAMDSAFDLEQSFTTTLANLAPSRESGEKLMPGAIYVLVAAMAGSIVTRNRNILLRASVPLAMGIGAGWTVLPVTSRNVADLAWKYEQRVPAIAETHLQIKDGLRKGVSFAKVHKDLGVRMVDEKVTDARETVEGWVKQGK